MLHAMCVDDRYTAYVAPASPRVIADVTASYVTPASARFPVDVTASTVLPPLAKEPAAYVPIPVGLSFLRSVQLS